MFNVLPHCYGFRNTLFSISAYDVCMYVCMFVCMSIYILLTYPKTYVGYDINPVIELSCAHCIAALNAKVWNSDRFVQRYLSDSALTSEQLLTLHFKMSQLHFKAICGNVLELTVEYLIP